MPESPSELGQIQSLRRSVTLPIKLNPLAQRRSSVPNTPEHVIFYHPSAKIVHFAPRALAPIPSSSAPSDFDYPVDTIETLPWRSATERTVATAPLRLEKVHGSTAFLKCGNVVHAILKNSQCWCVDGVSKFVLRIRPLTYYRIEIPYDSEDDQGLVQDLKIALPTVLRYEVTPCPFKRAFSVELPSDAMAPRRKKAWRPKERRESAPILESLLETSSPSSTRSEWLDSASTGDDTDGNLTDDSCFTSHKAKSIILETIPDDRESSPVEALRPSSSHSFPSRSVSETPQAFTSLLAKFQATPTAESLRSDSEHKYGDLPGSQAVNTNELVVGAAANHDTAEDPPKLQVDNAVEVHSELETTVNSEPTPVLEPMAEPAPEVGGAFPVEPTSEAVLLAESEMPVQPERMLEAEELCETKPTIVVETEEQQELKAGNDAQINFTTDEAVDHDASFASSPESFHSAEPQSPDSVSTHPTSVGGHDLPEPIDMFSLPSAQEIISGMESTSASLCKKSELPALNSCQSPEISAQTGVPDLSSPSYLSPDAFSDTSPSMARTSKAYEPSPISDAPLTTKTVIQPVVKTPALNTDFNHMSAEFRRRAKATRERDVSPMPHSSALYLPSPNDDAKSFISKAITLVLIPPAYLFVILLHIAARVVINPPTAQPAVGVTPSGPNSNSRKTNKDPATEDDFSFPLEPQTSSEYEDAEMSRKLDPWDLD
jgi:hypothetical protein